MQPAEGGREKRECEKIGIAHASEPQRPAHVAPRSTPSRAVPRRCSSARGVAHFISRVVARERGVRVLHAAAPPASVHTNVGQCREHNGAPNEEVYAALERYSGSNISLVSYNSRTLVRYALAPLARVTSLSAFVTMATCGTRKGQAPGGYSTPEKNQNKPPGWTPGE